MRVEQIQPGDVSTLTGAHLVLVFGNLDALKLPGFRASLRSKYPNAHIVGCSTAGEIAGDHVRDETVHLTAVEFSNTRVQSAFVHLPSHGSSYSAARSLAMAIPSRDLRHAIVFSEGIRINGSELSRGLKDGLPPNVSVTGGLAADGDRFGQTWVLSNDAEGPDHAVIVGLYGPSLRVGFGSLGGWDSFGPERRITSSSGNRLTGLDGESALALYKKYLGEHASSLPSSALLFPLAIRAEGDDRFLVRTILGIDESDQSLIFAGDMPQGWLARLMKANFDRLIDGAEGAATTASRRIGNTSPELALLISCVGRKLVLKQRVEEEIEAVRSVVGPGAALTGFYSYGEIAPVSDGSPCELHNQTMTITTLAEGE